MSYYPPYPTEPPTPEPPPIDQPPPSQATVAQRGLFMDASNWPSKKGPDINSPASVDFRAAQHADGTMVVSNAIDQNYGGALCSYHLPLPIVDGKLLRYIAYHLEFLFAPSTFYNLARHEVDMKVCVKTRPNSSTQIRNVANFSTQWNTETGQFQIDKDPPQWVNTGYIIDPRTVDPRKWHTLDYRFWFDETAQVFSVLSISFDGATPYQIPANMQRVPMQLTNWEQVVSCQLQNEGFRPGAVVIQYDKGVILWSGQPIPPGAAGLSDAEPEREDITRFPPVEPAPVRENCSDSDTN